MAEILIGEGHNGGAIAAKAGDILVVSLPENPTTGFRWTVTEPASRVLRLQSDNFLPAAPDRVGGGGLRTLRYVAVASGEAALVLHLARPWEATAPRLEFRVRINVSQ